MIGDELVYAALLGFALLLFLIDLKLMMFPYKKGRIIAVEDQLCQAEKACSCGELKMGGSHINARVRLEDGEEVDVRVSPCLFCMDKVKLGSQIGVNRIGDRLVGRRYIDILGRGLANDDVPVPGVWEGSPEGAGEEVGS